MRTGTLALLCLCCLVSPHAFADSIQTFHITDVSMFMGTNDGSGDNVFFSFTGPGVTITGIGGMACFDWCSSFQGVSDPSSASPSQIFISDFLTATVGGKSYDPTSLDFQSLFDGSGGVKPLAIGSVGEGDTFFQFNLIMPAGGQWDLSFAYDNDTGLYFFTKGQFHAEAPIVTPEPSTIALTLTGLAGIAGLAKRKLTTRR